MQLQGTAEAVPSDTRTCLDLIELSIDQVTAALFVWSQLPWKGTDPRSAVVGDDLAVIVAANGAASVGATAEWLDGTAVVLPVLADRLAWCRRAAAALTGARALVVAL